jgi:hypothetical protein
MERKRVRTISTLRCELFPPQQTLGRDSGQMPFPDSRLGGVNVVTYAAELDRSLERPLNLSRGIANRGNLSERFPFHG